MQVQQSLDINQQIEEMHDKIKQDEEQNKIEEEYNKQMLEEELAEMQAN